MLNRGVKTIVIQFFQRHRVKAVWGADSSQAGRVEPPSGDKAKGFARVLAV